MLAGRHVLQAARQLQGQPFSPSHREVLAAAAKGILTETAKVTPEGMVLKGVVGRMQMEKGQNGPFAGSGWGVRAGAILFNRMRGDGLKSHQAVVQDGH